MCPQAFLPTSLVKDSRHIAAPFGFVCPKGGVNPADADLVDGFVTHAFLGS